MVFPANPPAHPLLDAIAAPAVVLDRSGRIHATNDAWRLFAVLNGADQQAVGPGADYLLACEQAGTDEIADGIRRVLDGEQVLYEVEYACPSPTEDRWFLLRAFAAPVAGGDGAVLVHLDVTHRHLVEPGATGEGIDPSTGLVDRARATALVADLLRRTVPEGDPVEVVTVTLDGLRSVSDVLGDAATDQLVVQVVARLRRAVRRGDVLCRTGDAEVIVVRPASIRHAGPILAERLRAVLDEPYQVGAHEIVLGMTVEAGLLGPRGEVIEHHTVDPPRTALPATRILGPDVWGNEPVDAGPLPGAERDAVMRARTAVLDAVGEAVLALDGDGCVIHLNPAAEHLYGWTNAEARGRDIAEVGPSDLSRDEVAEIVAHVRAGGSWAGELVIRDRHGHPFGAQVTATPLTIAGTVAAVITSTVDVSHRMEALADLTHRVSHDGLTGLRTRTSFTSSLEGHLARLGSSPAADSGAVLLLDLEDFQAHNRAHGLEMGDHLIRAAAAALRQAAHTGDLLARFSGDSFAIWCSHLPDLDRVTQFADELREAIARPIDVGGAPVIIRSSAGLAMTGTPVPSSAELLRRAGTALLDAKAAGRVSLPYHPHMDERLRRLAHTEVLVRRVVAGEAPLAYQAITRLADGVVVGAEALLRVQDDTGELVPPPEVFAAADRAGLASELGRLVLEAACVEAARWRSAAPERQLVVAVNLSAEQFADRDLVDHVRGALAAADLEPSRLSLEIAESALLGDTAWSARQLAVLAMQGVRLSVDDYGTGHTSLLHLKRFPLDTMKVDLSLVAGLPDSPEDLAVVTATMGVAQALDIRVVAVGVETERQLAELERLGCQYGQGFLWSSATSGDAFLALASAPVPVRAPRAVTSGRLVAAAPARAVSVDELDSILRSLVHEIRTPLTVAMGYASMLEMAPEDDRVGVASRIRAATERINRLLANLEDVRLIDHGTLVLNAQRLDLRAHLEATVGDLRSSTRRRIDLVQVGDDEILVEADDGRISGAIANLVNNALKYGQPGSAVAVRVGADDEWAQVTVIDDGPGVAQADLGVIYRKYGRGERLQSGSGLGLYLARGTARAHGGDIHYRREEPGSAFTLTLPRARRGDLTAQPVSRHRAGTGGAG